MTGVRGTGRIGFSVGGTGGVPPHDHPCCVRFPEACELAGGGAASYVRSYSLAQDQATSPAALAISDVVVEGGNQALGVHITSEQGAISEVRWRPDVGDVGKDQLFTQRAVVDDPPGGRRSWSFSLDSPTAGNGQLLVTHTHGGNQKLAVALVVVGSTGGYRGEANANVGGGTEVSASPATFPGDLITTHLSGGGGASESDTTLSTGTDRAFAQVGGLGGVSLEAGTQAAGVGGSTTVTWTHTSTQRDLLALVFSGLASGVAVQHRWTYDDTSAPHNSKQWVEAIPALGQPRLGHRAQGASAHPTAFHIGNQGLLLPGDVNYAAGAAVTPGATCRFSWTTDNSAKGMTMRFHTGAYGSYAPLNGGADDIYIPGSEAAGYEFTVPAGATSLFYLAEADAVIDDLELETITGGVPAIPSADWCGPPPAATDGIGSIGPDSDGTSAKGGHRHPVQSAAATPIEDEGGHYTAGQVEAALQEAAERIAAAIAALEVSTIPFIVDGGGAAITTGVKGDFPIDFAHEILAVTLLADQSGSIVLDVWRDTYANFPPTVADTITASAKPTLASAQKSQDTTLTGWSKTGAAGSIYRINVDSAATVQRVTLAFKVRRIV